tara:strand:+ start:83 stop:235 length:153 start_codon:yes stop_codon:yes gene_type:complete
MIIFYLRILLWGKYTCIVQVFVHKKTIAITRVWNLSLAMVRVVEKVCKKI